MGRYQQSFAEQRRQFGVGAGQWQQQFGLSQQQLAQQAQQFKESQPGFWDYLIQGVEAAAGFVGG